MGKIIRRETRKRGFFGWLFFIIFIGFNVLMAIVAINSFATVNELGKTITNDAQRAGHAIGSFMGIAMIVGIWAAGALITGLLALLTRGRKTIVEDYEL